MSPRSIHRLRWLAAVALYWCGIVPAIRWIRRGREREVLILRYHRVLEGGPAGRFYRLGIPRDVFREQIGYLRWHYPIEGLEKAARSLQGAAAPAAERGLSIVLTFDDGYGDNFEPARWLAREGIPATIFAVSGALDEGRPFFWERLATLFESAPELAALDESERRRRFDLERKAVKEMSQRDREAHLLRLAGQLGFEPGGCERPSDRPLSWEEARLLRREGIRFGGHTVTHPLLTRLPDDEVRREVGDGIRRLSEMLGEPIESFAYPTGDVDGRVRDLTASQGVSIAVSCEGGRNARGEDPLWLRRKGVGESLGQDPSGRFSKALWAAEIEGVFDALRRAGKAGRAGRRPRVEVPRGSGEPSASRRGA